MTYLMGEEKPSLEDVLEHHGVKGMKWGVRRTDGGSIAPNVQRHMEKAETKFQAKRAAANSKVSQNHVRGVVNPKDQARAAQLNSQHRRNQQYLKKQGLETYKSSTVQVSRKERRLQTKQERENFYQEKANNILKTALKDPEALVLLSHPGGRTVVTGREFVNHMSNGGLMDIKVTDIYATRTNGQGPYVLNANMNQRFVPSHKK